MKSTLVFLLIMLITAPLDNAMKMPATDPREPTLSKADAVLEREENFYRVFSIVKYSYLSRNTFKTFVVMHVTSRKLTF